MAEECKIEIRGCDGRTRRPLRYKINEKGCHICISHKDIKIGGYIAFYDPRTSNKSILIHRYIWEMHNGKIPDGMYVCHKCDTPACININHLFLGTPYDNSMDMHNKGRDHTVRGERQGLAKLTTEKAIAIYNTVGKTTRQIAKEYGVAQRTICAIKIKKTWRHIHAIISADIL